MEPKPILIGAGTALGILLLGVGYMKTDAGPDVEVSVAQAASEISGQGKTPLLAAIAKAGGVGDLTCERGTISNHPARVFCTDGKTAGFLLPAGLEKKLFDEVKADLPGFVSDRVEFRRDDVGGLFVVSHGVVAKK